MQSIELTARVGNAPDTDRIQAAIDDLASAGGGTLTLTGGTFLATTINLRSYITLHVDANATLRAVGDITAYTPAPNGRYHFLYADGAEHLTIEGDGVVDGNGYAFWDIPARRFLAEGGDPGDLHFPGKYWEDDSPFWREHNRRIQPMIELRRCTNLTVRGITIANSPGWTLHPWCCDHVRIANITIANEIYGPNTDGIDLTGCRNVVVTGCEITTGDDAIILKAHEDARSCEHIAVSDCIIRTHCAALGIGAETVHAIREVGFSNCIVPKALRIVQIELWSAGLVENVTISNVSGANMTDIPLERPIYIDIQQHGRENGELGVVRNVLIQNLTALTRGRIVFTAQDGATIEDVTLRDVQLTIPEIEDPEVSVTSSRSRQMSNYNPETRSKRALVVLDNCRRINLVNLSSRWPGTDAAAAALRRSSDDGASYPGDGSHNEDKRKQASVTTEVPMHALYARNSHDVLLDSPFLTPYGNADAVVTVNSSVTVRPLGR
jgi:polygalacturonase